MKRILITAMMVAVAAASPLTAKRYSAKKMANPGVEVTQRDARGRPTMVRIEGQEVAVCMDGKTDSCINPREAGLNFGNNPIANWPGHPASEGKPR